MRNKQTDIKILKGINLQNNNIMRNETLTNRTNKVTTLLIISVIALYTLCITLTILF